MPTLIRLIITLLFLAGLVYAGALIDARFSLNDSGMIEMVEEEPVAADLAVGAERWIGQFRLPPEEERP